MPERQVRAYVAGTVSVIAWNPRRNLVGGRLPLGPRRANFGDLLGPLIVQAIVGRRLSRHRTRQRGPRLLTVGSILHFARTGDSVWGTGVRGAIPIERYTFNSLDVRAVRGPLTRDHLQQLGIEVPQVYGDPGLLVPELFPDLTSKAKQKRSDFVVVPHYTDYSRLALEHKEQCINPCGPVRQCLRRIAEAERVISSSLHGLVIADALGIPSQWLECKHESDFKYRDYVLGSGREPHPPFRSVQEALANDPQPVPTFAGMQALLDAFPHDLWP